MPQIVSEFEPTAGRRGPKSSLDPAWFDGKIRRFEKDKDFMKATSMRTNLYQNAWRRGLTGNAQIVDGGDALLFRAVPRPNPVSAPTNGVDHPQIAKANRIKRDMRCRAPRCKQRSRGPRYGYFCLNHDHLHKPRAKAAA